MNRIPYSFPRFAYSTCRGESSNTYIYEYAYVYEYEQGLRGRARCVAPRASADAASAA